MQQALAMRPEYHSALGYVGLLVSGELTTVHVRVNNSDGTLGDFRTPSHTPSNQIGGARASSEASQQMHILLRGRNLRGTFFEDAVHRRLKAPPPKGWGLTFALSRRPTVTNPTGWRTLDEGDARQLPRADCGQQPAVRTQGMNGQVSSIAD
jgi:hypothetical protein